VKFSEFFFQGSPVPVEFIRGSDDPDATLYRQLEQYVLDHHANLTRSGCLPSEILKSVVYEPETLNLQDPKYQHIMECAECLREVIGFREARQAQSSLRPQILSKSRRTFSVLSLIATAAACIVVGIALGTHGKHVAVTSEREVRSEVLDLSRSATARGVDGGQPALLMKDVGLLIVELPPLSPAGTYQVTLQRDDGEPVVSGQGTAATKDGKIELRVRLNLMTLPAGTYRLGLKGEQDSAPYLYPIELR
jgi:hypothetical protein